MVVATAILDVPRKTRQSRERSDGPLPLDRPAICSLEEVWIAFGGTEAEFRIAAALFPAWYHPNGPRRLCPDFSKTDFRGI